MPEPLTVIILAGGRSTRMGQDKAWLTFDGQPLIRHVIQRVLPLAAQIVISSNQPERFAGLSAGIPAPFQVVTDRHADAGPLAGLEAGLSAAAHDPALLVAVDMPFLSLPLLRYMLAVAGGHTAVVPTLPGPDGTPTEREPTHALYRRACLPAIRAHLAQGHRRMVSFLPDVDVRDLTLAEVLRYDPALLSFFNVNTPADWARALELLGSSRTDDV